MTDFIERANAEFQKSMKESEDFMRWLEDYPEQELWLEWKERTGNVNADMDEDVDYSRFISWAESIYRGEL